LWFNYFSIILKSTPIISWDVHLRRFGVQISETSYDPYETFFRASIPTQICLSQVSSHYHASLPSNLGIISNYWRSWRSQEKQPHFISSNWLGDIPARKLSQIKRKHRIESVTDIRPWHKTYKILNIHLNCLNLWNMILFWFFGAYFIEICGKLGMRMKFVSRHVECQFFLTVLRFFEKRMNCFWILHNFPLAYILSFQKTYICPKKIFGTSELSKKIRSQIPLFSANFDFEAQLFNEIFKISNPNFSHVNLSKTLFCIKIYQQMAEISSKEGWKTSISSGKLWRIWKQFIFSSKNRKTAKKFSKQPTCLETNFILIPNFSQISIHHFACQQK
jgi:hypothetical protein